MSANWPMRFEISINNQTNETLIHSNQGVFGECAEDPGAKTCESGFTLAPNHIVWDNPQAITDYIDRVNHQSVFMGSLKAKANKLGNSALYLLKAANIYLSGADDDLSKAVLKGYDISAQCLSAKTDNWEECSEIEVKIKSKPPANGLDGIDTFWDFATSTIHIQK